MLIHYEQPTFTFNQLRVIIRLNENSKTAYQWSSVKIERRMCAVLVFTRITDSQILLKESHQLYKYRDYR